MMAGAMPYVLAAAGAGVQFDALNKAQQLKNKMTQDALDYDAQQAAKTRNLLTTSAQKYDPATRAGALDNTTQQLASGLSSYLQKNQTVPGAPATTGKTTNDFVAGKAENALNEGTRTALLTKLYSKMFAPGQLMFNEGIANANTGAQTESIAADRASQQRARMFAISQVRPNTNAMLLGKLMSLGAGASKGSVVSPTADYPG